MFVSHARSLEELKTEFLQSIRKDINRLYAYRGNVAKSKTEQAKLATAIGAMEDLYKYWEQVQLIKKAKSRAKANE